LILPDVNVLLYAFRSDSRDHGRYRRWLEDVLNGPSTYGLCPETLTGVIRISTHPKIFPKPSLLADALAFANTLKDQRHCQLVQPGSRHWGIFSDLCNKAAASGNLIQDAWFAALAIEAGCEWITSDRDFARFPGLRWNPPF
jgi:toxin-antitoxin system PIN domain toxin